MFTRFCAFFFVWVFCVGSAHAQSLSAEVSALRKEIQSEMALIRQQQARLQGKFQSETQDRRRLQGEIEEMNFRLRNLEGRIDSLVSSLDQRLQDIEDTLNLSIAPTASEEPAEKQKPAVHTLGTIKTDSSGKVIGASQAQQTFEDRYAHAIELIGEKSYAQARQNLQALIKEDAQHALSSNILYWLGESYYAEGDYTNAMSKFARSAKQYPDGAKRLDSLLKIGLSLGNLGRLEQACKVLHDMINNVKNVPSDIALNRDNARERFGCGR